MSSGIPATEVEAPVPAIPPTGRPISFRFVPALDGIRAVAVLGVMLYHGGAPLVGGGFMGVNMFFVLSGFLITSLLLGEWVKRHDHPAGPVLDPTGPPAAAGPAGDAGRGGHLRQGVRHAGGVRQPPPRLALHAVLRGQLAFHLQREQLLRSDVTAFTAGAHVVALDRGAVLHRLAAGGPVDAAPGPEAPAVQAAVAHLRHGSGRSPGLGGRYAVLVLPPRLGDPALRRYRHPLPGHLRRRFAGHRHGHLG